MLGKCQFPTKLITLKLKTMVTLAVLLFIVAVISIGWASGIHTMKEEHPEYKGNDFLNENGDLWTLEKSSEETISKEKTTNL